MFSRTKSAHLWSLLAIATIAVSALPYSQPDVADFDFDCEEWDTADEPNSSQVTTSTPTSATALPTTLASPYSTTASSPATTSTSVRIAQASSTTTPSLTSSFIAPINSFIPVTPPSYAFYLESSSSSSSGANGLYAAVNAGAGQPVSLVADKTLATKFTIDSSGDLVEQSPSQGHVANLESDVDIQKVSFYPYGTDGNYGKLNCQRQQASLDCNVDGVLYHAATCGGDGNLYFGKTIPTTCTGVVLVPILP